MAVLAPVQAWDGVYQFETTDLLQGGAGGIDNDPNQNLTNRTQYIYDALFLAGTPLATPVDLQIAGDTDANLIYVDVSGDNVGIGTATPNSTVKLDVIPTQLIGIRSVSGITAGVAIFGNSTVTSGSASYGVVGESSNSLGAGVKGASNGDTSYGIFGTNTNTGAFINFGGYFEAAGTIGVGVHGDALATGNYANLGGQFNSYGNIGIGLAATAIATGAYTNYGGSFIAHGDTGVGITCLAISTNAGLSFGGQLTSSAASAGDGITTAPTGGYGESANTGNYGFGLHGISNSINGRGVVGQCLGATGHAIYGYTAVGTGKTTIYGDNRSTTASSFAGYFDIVATDAASHAVYGLSGGGSSYSGGGDTAWHTVSDKFKKINKRDVSVLDKLRAKPLKVKQFMYEDASNTGFTEYISPMAQDICNTFNLSDDDEKLGDNVTGGIALGGVIELLTIIDDLEKRLAVLEAV